VANSEHLQANRRR